MKKPKDKRIYPGLQPLQAAPAGSREPLLTKCQFLGITAGILLVGVGFYVLTQADPAGQNWAGRLCPFLILGGYGVIGAFLISGKI